MNELEFQEEWLSAYLDDELTEEQRLVVEQRLAIDPAAQATLEDLQRVRAMVAKLPSWSGPNLKFAIPIGVPGSFDEANDETENESHDELEDDELEDFEEVPRLIVGVEERRAASPANTNWNSNSGSTRSMLGWIATAASILLVAGLGYFYWPSSVLQFAKLDSNQAPSVAANAAPRVSEQDGKLESVTSKDIDLASSSNGNEVLNRAMEFGAQGGAAQGGAAPGGAAPAGAEGRSETRLAERTDPAPLAGVAALNASDVSSDSKKKTEMNVIPASPSLPGAALGGFGGAHSATDLAMNNMPADAPAAAELPPPSPAKAIGNEGAGSANVANADSVMGDKAQRNALPGPTVFYARSQSWQDEETQSTLSLGAQQNRADQLAFGSNAFQRGAEQKRGEVASDSVLMAAIKPEVANSPEFFPNLVNSNRLVEVDQRPLLNQAFAANQQSTNSVATGRLESTRGITSAAEPANAPTSNMFSNNRFQMAMPNQPQSNSFILFLNRNEANQILNQLQEKGQVSSQIWRVIKQPESQVTLGQEVNNTSAPEPPITTDQRVTGEPLNQKPESVSDDRVILMLNGPPN